MKYAFKTEKDNNNAKEVEFSLQSHDGSITLLAQIVGETAKEPILDITEKGALHRYKNPSLELFGLLVNDVGRISMSKVNSY